MELFKFNDGLFAGKEVRSTKEYVSVFDIILVATGQQKNAATKTWSRIKEQYFDDIDAFCHGIKFSGRGQKETPCIQKEKIDILIRCILMNNRMSLSKKQEVMKIFNIPFNELIVKTYTEEEIHQNIIKVFKNHDCIQQFKILYYRIDLYFPKQHIAIECDENNHKTYKNDIKRENEITNILNCKWIRYDPFNKNFDIFKLIHDINLQLQSYKNYNEYRIKEQEKKEETQIKELNVTEEKLLEEIKEIRIDRNKLVQMVKEEAPQILEKFEEVRLKDNEHKKQYKKNPVYQYTLDGEFIKEFESVSVAAKTYECSTKIIRKTSQTQKQFNGYLWRIGEDVNYNKANLQQRQIEQCDSMNYSVLHTFESFDEIVQKYKNESKFEICEVYRSVDLGYIYYDYRWKFIDTPIKIGKELGRTGARKKVARLDNDKNILEIYKSVREASDKQKLSKGAISQAVSKNIKRGGFYWKYI